MIQDIEASSGLEIEPQIFEEWGIFEKRYISFDQAWSTS